MSWFKRKPTMQLVFASDQYEIFTANKGQTLEVFEKVGMTQLSLFSERAYQVVRALRGGAIMAEEYPSAQHSATYMLHSS